MKVHPEFGEAMEEAQFAALAWWEDMGHAGLKMGSKFSASLYAYQMKNRFRYSYADKVDVAHTAKEEPEERQLTDIELARRIAFILTKATNSCGSSESESSKSESSKSSSVSMRNLRTYQPAYGRALGRGLWKSKEPHPM